ncbi:MAG: hypothetical protein HQL38_03095 [Alphaproteobacteria bacterium]|nr:hypothetical protein [Alphaproteobacteria bacterium]
MSKKPHNETEDAFLRRVDRTFRKKVKDGGPTYDELARAISIKLRRKSAVHVAIGFLSAITE